MALPTASTKGWGAKALTASTTIANIAAEGHRRSLTIKNTGTVTAYLGGSDLTSGNATTEGYPLAQGEVISFGAAESGEPLSVPIYYITAASTTTLVVLAASE